MVRHKLNGNDHCCEQRAHEWVCGNDWGEMDFHRLVRERAVGGGVTGGENIHGSGPHVNSHLAGGLLNPTPRGRGNRSSSGIGLRRNPQEDTPG